MIRRFVRDSVIYGTGSVLTKAIGLFLLPVLTRVLTPLDFGLLELIALLTTFIRLSVALEISQALGRFYADARTTGQQATLASTTLWFSAAAYSAFAVLAILGAGPFTSALFESEARRPLFVLAVVSIWLSGLLSLALNHLRWRLEPGRHLFVSVLNAALAAVLALALVVVFNAGVTGVIAGQAVAAAVALAFALWNLRDDYRLTFDLSACRRLLAYSVPLVPSSVAVFVSLYVDRLVVKEFLGLEELGVYSVAYRFAAVAGVIVSAFQFSVTPLIYQNYRGTDAPSEIARMLRYSLALALIFSTALGIFAREVLMVVTGPGFQRAADLIPLLCLAIVAFDLYVFVPGLALVGKTRVIAAINVTAALTNLALTLLLVPRLGLHGAVLSTVVSGTASFVMYAWFGQQHYPIPHTFKRALTALAITAAGVFAARGLPLHGPALIIAKATLTVLASAAAGWLLVGPPERGLAFGRAGFRIWGAR